MENTVNKEVILGGDIPSPNKEVKDMECKCKFNVNKQTGNTDVQFYSSDDTTELYKALAGFHKHFTTVEKNEENPFHESTYASLSQILNVIRPILNDQGLILMQMPVSGTKENSICIKTRLIHVESQQFIETNSISVTPNKNDIQLFGSLMTYLKRYEITSLLGLSFSEEDDDGNSSMLASKEEEEETKPVTKPKSSRRSL